MLQNSLVMSLTMWGARKVTGAVGLMMVLAGEVASNVTVYRDSGQGSCGDNLQELQMDSVTVCAIVCSHGKEATGCRVVKFLLSFLT